MRDPHSLIYSGAPGFTMAAMLFAFSRAREIVPDLSLKIHLTREDIPKPPAPAKSALIYQLQEVEKAVQRMLKGDGVERIAESEVRRAAVESAIWCYPTHLPEDIVPMAILARKSGAIPIYHPIGCLANFSAGIPIIGLAFLEPMTQMRYAYTVAQLALDGLEQHRLRSAMA